MIKYMISLLSFMSVALVALIGFVLLLDSNLMLGLPVLIIGIIAGIPWVQYTTIFKIVVV